MFMTINNTLKVRLEKEMETLLITLKAKASDSCSNKTILNDKKAAEILNMIDYDFEKIKGFGNEIMVVRAKQFDTWLVEFLDTNPITTVLNLGCGLDTRVERINPSSTVSWFDVDYPDVIDFRKNFFSNKEGYEMIPSSVTELGWLEQIPKDRPAMIIAEGILEYLTENEVKTLLNRIINYFPQGQIVFDVMNSFAVNSGKEELKATTGAVHRWTVDDILSVDQINPKMKRLVDLSVFKSNYMHRLPLKTRLLYSTMCLIPNFKNMMRLLLYRF